MNKLAYEDALKEWKRFEQYLVETRYGMRDPETGELLEHTYDDVIERVIKTLKERTKLPEEVYDYLRKRIIIPASPVLMNLGSPRKNKTYFSCFAYGPVEDNMDSILKSVYNFGKVFKAGAGIGCSLSKLRPRGALVDAKQGVSSGPVGFLPLYDAVTGTVSQGGCFPYDTLIFTDKGLLPIGRIVEEKLNVKVWTPFGWKRVVNWFKNGKKHFVKVRNYFNLDLYVTKNHHFFTFDNGELVTKPISEFTVDDVLLLNGSPVMFDGFRNNLFDVNFYYMLGHYLANGCTRRKRGIYTQVEIAFGETDAGFRALERCKGVLSYFGNAHVKKGDGACQTLSIFSSDLIAILDYFGFLKEPNTNFAFPELILTSDFSSLIAFLAGYLDGDGNISRKYVYKLTSINRDFLKTMQIALFALGVPVRFTLDREARGNWKTLYGLFVHGAYGYEQMSKIFSNVMEKTDYKERRKAFGYGVRPIDLGNVITTKFGGLEETDFVGEGYDLEVEDVHMYYANGYLVHNSRKGATLISLSASHPDVIDFARVKWDRDINQKYGNYQLQNMNISIEVEKPNDLLDNKELLDLVVDGMYHRGDPGLLLWCNQTKETTSQPVDFDVEYYSKLIDNFPEIKKFLDEGFYYCNACLVGDTYLLDGDYLRPIRDNSSTTYTSWATGQKEVVQLVLSNGLALELTPDHLILTVDGWCQVKDTKGKRLIPFGEKILSLDVPFDEDAMLDGLIWSCGHYIPQYNIVYFKPASLSTKAIKFLERMGFRLGKSGFYIKGLKIDFELGKDKLPWSLENRLISYWINFIRGICLLKHYSIQKRTLSLPLFLTKEVAEAFAKILWCFGIGCNVRKIRKPFSHKFPKHKDFVYWGVVIYHKGSRERFLKLLGYDVKVSDFTLPKLEVSDIKPIGIREVFDFKMCNGYPSNVTCGVVVKNCSEVMSYPKVSCSLIQVNLPECYRQGKDNYLHWIEKASYYACLIMTYLNHFDEAYPLSEMKMVNNFVDPVGVGCIGLHGLLMYLGVPYHKLDEVVSIVRKIFAHIFKGTIKASYDIYKCQMLSGIVPKFWNPEFIENVRQELSKEGLLDNELHKILSENTFANAFTMSIAPTGTTSQFAYSASTSIEPLYSVITKRKVRDFNNNWIDFTIVPLEAIETGKSFDELEKETALCLTGYEQIDLLASAIKFVPTNISKTINIPADFPKDEIKSLIEYAIEKGLKGLTVFRDSSAEQVLQKGDAKSVILPSQKEKTEPNFHSEKEMPDIREGKTYKFRGPISLYITINKHDKKIKEVFLTMGKAGSTVSTLNKALGRVISVALQKDPDLINKIIDTLEGMGGDLTLINSELGMTTSVPDAIARALKKELDIEVKDITFVESKNLSMCPNCGKMALRRSGGCNQCLSCGYSSC